MSGDDGSSEIPQNGKITRRQVLFGGAKAVGVGVAAAAVKTAEMALKLASEPLSTLTMPETRIALPVVLEKYSHFWQIQAATLVAKKLPIYPLRAIGENKDHVPLPNLLVQAIDEFNRLDGGPLKIDRSQMISPSDRRKIGPVNILELLTPETFDDFVYRLPSTTQVLLGWSNKNFHNRLDIAPEMDDSTKPFVNTWLTSLVTRQLRDEINDALFLSLEEMKKIEEERKQGIINQQVAIDRINKSNEMLDKSYARVGLPVTSALEELKVFVEERAKKEGGPVSPAVVIGYCMKRNQGDVLKGIMDATIFLKSRARNAKNGIFCGDMPESEQNLIWYRDNLIDTSKWANWGVMPFVTGGVKLIGYESETEIRDFLKTIGNGYSVEEDLRDIFQAISVENVIGSLYHQMNAVLLSFCLPPEWIAPGNVARTIDHGSLKVAREAYGVKDLVAAMKYLHGL